MDHMKAQSTKFGTKVSLMMMISSLLFQPFFLLANSVFNKHAHRSSLKPYPKSISPQSHSDCGEREQRLNQKPLLLTLLSWLLVQLPNECLSRVKMCIGKLGFLLVLFATVLSPYLETSLWLCKSIHHIYETCIF